MRTYINNFNIPEDGNKVEMIEIKDLESIKSLKSIEECLLACPNVKKINISIYFLPQKDKDIKPKFSMGEIISTIATHGKNIESLCLQAPFLEDKDLIPISNDNFPKLRILGLSRNFQIKAEGIKYIATQCPELNSLDLHYSLYHGTDEAALYIGKYLPKLKYLSMHRCCKLSDKGLIAIAEGCKNLEMIEVGRNYDLTDEALKSLGENCKKLRYIGMYYNKRTTEKGLQYLIEGCPKLETYADGGGWGAIPALKDIKSKYPHINFS